MRVIFFLIPILIFNLAYAADDTSSEIRDKLDDGTSFSKGYSEGQGLIGELSNEEGLQGITGSLQTGKALEPLGKNSYYCTDKNAQGEIDKETIYFGMSECQSHCKTACAKYTFSVELSCEKAEEIVKVTPPQGTDQLKPNPKFKIKYNDITITTEPVSAICSNGYMSEKNGEMQGYTWNLNNRSLVDKFDVKATSHSMSTGANNAAMIGECIDLRDNSKTFLSSYSVIYNYMGKGLLEQVSKRGLLPVASINGKDLSLSINVVVAGSCADNNAGGLPNQAQILTMSKTGNLSDSEIASLQKNNEIYEAVRTDKSYEPKSCVVKNTVSLKPNTTQKSGNYNLCTNRFIFGRLVQDKGKVYIEFRGGRDKKDEEEVSLKDAACIEADKGQKITDTGWHIADVAIVPANNRSMELTFSACSGGESNYSMATGSSIINNIDCNPYMIPSSQTQSLTYTYKYNVDVLSVINSNGCAGVSNDCKIYSEEVCLPGKQSCVETIKEGIATESKSKRMCYEATTGVDRYTICTDGKTITAYGSNGGTLSASGGFFEIYRSYRCAVEGDYDKEIADIVAASNTVTDSVQYSSSGDLTFKGKDKDGKVTNYNINIQPEKTECQKVCKVSKPVSADDNKIMLDEKESAGVPLKVNTFTTNTREYNKVCSIKKTKDNTSYSCPMEAGETMVKDCDCADDFTEAVIQIKMIEQLGDNIKCSSK